MIFLWAVGLIFGGGLAMTGHPAIGTLITFCSGVYLGFVIWALRTSAPE